jgi:F-type H+-transporting ATPase subunit a
LRELSIESIRLSLANYQRVVILREKDADRFVPYLLTAFFFILFMNLFGLVPFAATATANLSVTVMLALFTFLITQFAAIKSMGFGGYLAHLTGGVPNSHWFLWVIMIPAIFMLELFVAFVQAYIFAMLSSLFIGAGLVHHGHHDAHGDDHGSHASHVAGTVPDHG